MGQDRTGIVAGIDVGGTFTDLVQLDQKSGEVRFAKVPSTPDNQAFGVMGAALVLLDEHADEDAARALLDAGCEAVVVHFLHAYANPAHERRAGEILSRLWPNGHITLGHAILQESREFERGVTAAVNASVQPILDRYLARLSSELNAGGYDRDILVMNGNGGRVSSRLVAREAAEAVIRLANTTMAGAIRMVSLSLGGGIRATLRFSRLAVRGLCMPPA